MKFKHLSFFLAILILLFFIVILPGYYFSESAIIGKFRNYYYLICLFACAIFSVSFLATAKIKKAGFPFLLLLFTFLAWTLLILVDAINNYSAPWARNDIISLSYCWFALLLGINLANISNHPFFSGLVLVVWSATCLLIISKVDPIYMQAIYGKENEGFSGSYQYIGDTLALVSIMLASKIIAPKNKLKSKELVISKKQDKITLLSALLLIISSIILFINASRASLFSFLIFSFYFLCCSLRQLSTKGRVISSLLGLLLTCLLVTGLNNSLLPDINYEVFLSNRNFELIVEGRSDSGEMRDHLYELSIQDISNHPITGSYVSRNLYRGVGTYVHNIVALIQDFGIFSFLSYLCLIFYCIKVFLAQWGKSQDFNSIVYQGILIFSILQILFFRDPLGFYIIFINFGMTLRLMTLRSLFFE